MNPDDINHRQYLHRTLPSVHAKRYRLRELKPKADAGHWPSCLESVLLNRQIEHELMGRVIRGVRFSS